MRVATIFGTALALTVGIGGVTDGGAQAVQLRDGTVYFVQPPDLVEATTTFKDVNVWGATYYFTINVPQNAGEPLQRVTITQRSGGNIRYDLDDTRAFVGTRSHKGARLTLGQVIRERETRTIFVNFDPPVTPGQTVTIGLRPVQNPRYSGVYLFGVTAFPQVKNPTGNFSVSDGFTSMAMGSGDLASHEALANQTTRPKSAAAQGLPPGLEGQLEYPF